VSVAVEIIENSANLARKLAAASDGFAAQLEVPQSGH
jgi:hypothetical protein